MTGSGPSARRPILLIGKTGQIGWELERTLAPLAPVVALSRRELDLTDTDAIRRQVRETAPGLIVNAAAYTTVDDFGTIVNPPIAQSVPALGAPCWNRANPMSMMTGPTTIGEISGWRPPTISTSGTPFSTAVTAERSGAKSAK